MTEPPAERYRADQLVEFSTDLFRAAGLEPEVVAGPMGEDRDRYIGVRER